MAFHNRTFMSGKNFRVSDEFLEENPRKGENDGEMLETQHQTYQLLESSNTENVIGFTDKDYGNRATITTSRASKRLRSDDSFGPPVYVFQPAGSDTIRKTDGPQKSNAFFFPYIEDE